MTSPAAAGRTPQEDTQIVGRLPLVSGLDAAIVDEFVRRSRQRRYSRGTVIFHKDDPGSLLYVIVKGKVQISMPSMEGKDLVLNILTSGSRLANWHCSTTHRETLRRKQQRTPSSSHCSGPTSWR